MILYIDDAHNSHSLNNLKSSFNNSVSAFYYRSNLIKSNIEIIHKYAGNRHSSWSEINTRRGNNLYLTFSKRCWHQKSSRPLKSEPNKVEAQKAFQKNRFRKHRSNKAGRVLTDTWDALGETWPQDFTKAQVRCKRSLHEYSRRKD